MCYVCHVRFLIVVVVVLGVVVVKGERKKAEMKRTKKTG